MTVELLAVSTLVAVAGALTIRFSLSRAGLLKGRDKPDCGCGTCRTATAGEKEV